MNGPQTTTEALVYFVSEVIRAVALLAVGLVAIVLTFAVTLVRGK